ncbi:MAG: hypothetical protein SOZ84_09400 [Treponema sp.]|nr:hypothetical protein [Treponema sp.]
MILLLASCKDGLTIFDQIDQETKLEDAVITGSVNSIVKSDNTLYASDGNIYAKSVNAVRDWSKIASPGGTIIKLAADATNIYALNADRVLYTSTNGSAWNTINTSSTGTIETIFWDGDTNAYLKTTAGKFYKLQNVSSPSQEESSIKSTVIVKNNGYTYSASGSTVSVNNGSDLGSVDVDATVYSLTYSKADSAIYAGTSKGLKKLPVGTDGKLTGAKLDPPGNWGATIKSYEAFAVLATGTTPNDFALYSSTIKGGTTYAKVNGLWGYYNSRNNWNRE